MGCEQRRPPWISRGNERTEHNGAGGLGGEAVRMGGGGQQLAIVYHAMSLVRAATGGLHASTNPHLDYMPQAKHPLLPRWVEL